MVPCVIVIKDQIVDENILCKDSEEAEKLFFAKCEESISNWDEYSEEDKEAILENGVAEKANGSICLSWASNYEWMKENE